MKRDLTKEREKKLRKLGKLANRRAANPPPLLKDIIICMDIAMTSEETDFLLKIGGSWCSYDELVQRVEWPEKRFRPVFDSVRHKGMLDTRFGENGERRFALYPLFPAGWFDDTYLSDGEESPEKKEFAHHFEMAIRKLEKLNFFPVRPLFDQYYKKTLKSTISIAPITPVDVDKRLIQIDQSIESGASGVYPTHGVNELIEKYADSIGIKYCFCRQWRKFLDDPCRLGLPSESCLSFGDKTRKYTETGVGRPISKDEAYRIVNEAQQKGAVHVIYYMEEDFNQEEAHLCNCCWDCCGNFRLYHAGVQPLLVKSFYYARLKEDGCNGCETCVSHCPVNAIQASDEAVVIRKELCIGCGQCEYQCPEEAVELVLEERDVYLPLQKKSVCRF
jgi:ferredoxin